MRKLIVTSLSLAVLGGASAASCTALGLLMLPRGAQVLDVASAKL